jgi:glycine cleavage system aminomethyltransferase T
MAAWSETAAARSPLDEVLRRAGAHMSERDGWLVAADFGSLAAELAASRAAAGLVDVSSIGKFELHGSEQALDAAQPCGRPLAHQRSVEADDAWWCRLSPEVLLVLECPGATVRARAHLEEKAADHGLRLKDVTRERVALCLMGRAGREVLARVGTREVAPGIWRWESAAGIPTLVLRQSADRWLLAADVTEAVELWNGLSEAGAPLGLAHVGTDALQHLLAAGER